VVVVFGVTIGSVPVGGRLPEPVPRPEPGVGGEGGWLGVPVVDEPPVALLKSGAPPTGDVLAGEPLP
jgi:hypothetical protein